ncbi:MAG TPA: transposase [Prolixibacteraceae bacterium]|nr:transposase [Prolixibacteraceae bacterium]
MSKEFISCLMHVVVGTHGQRSFLTAEVRSQLSTYLTVVAKSKGMKLVALGGTENHLHVLLALPSKLSVESAILPLKQSSTTWIRQNFEALRAFSWATGFAAFSISRSQLDSTLLYIQNQEQYHWKKSFQEEYKDFLNYHHLPFNEALLFEE